MKTYVITVSRHFLKAHTRSGQPTNFVSGILGQSKIHTIRANFEFWSERIQEVQEGRAILSIRYWTGKPYNSSQAVVIDLDSSHGVGFEKMQIATSIGTVRVNGTYHAIGKVAKADGLTTIDFLDWFSKAETTHDFVLIHFTPFRYADKSA